MGWLVYLFGAPFSDLKDAREAFQTSIPFSIYNGNFSVSCEWRRQSGCRKKPMPRKMVSFDKISVCFKWLAPSGR